MVIIFRGRAILGASETVRILLIFIASLVVLSEDLIPVFTFSRSL